MKNNLYLLLISLVLCLLFSCRQKQEKNATTSDEIIPHDTSISDLPFIKDSSDVFICCEEMPIFPGGEKALFDYINRNTNYPKSAINDSLEGRVIVKFVIQANGHTDRVEILRGLRYDVDNECIKVIQAMPYWKPGKQWNKPVPVYFIIPIRFVLNKNKDSSGFIRIYPKEDQLASIKISLYPNPARDFLNIKLDELPDGAEFNLISLNGQLLKKGEINEYEQQINLQDLRDGLYIFTLNVSGSTRYSQKFIIKK